MPEGPSVSVRTQLVSYPSPDLISSSNRLRLLINLPEASGQSLIALSDELSSFARFLRGRIVSLCEGDQLQVGLEISRAARVLIDAEALVGRVHDELSARRRALLAREASPDTRMSIRKSLP